MIRRPVQLLIVAALATAGVAHAGPRTDYLLYCGGCHLENGAGDPPEVPDLGADLPRIAAADGGRAFLAQVPGSSQAPLSDARLAGVLNYLFDEFNTDADVPAFTAEEIAGYRGTTLLDPMRRREELLGQ